MGTSAEIIFDTKTYGEFKFYRHYDGYPEEMIPDLKKIFNSCFYDKGNVNKRSYARVAKTFYNVAKECLAFDSTLRTVSDNMYIGLTARKLCHYFEPTDENFDTNYKYFISTNNAKVITVTVFEEIVTRCQQTGQYKYNYRQIMKSPLKVAQTPCTQQID